MNQDMNTDLKPKIGFFPFFNSLGDTIPLLKVATYYKKLGGETVFYSHGGAYEGLVRAKGFEVIKVNPYYENKTNKEITYDLFYGKNLKNAVAKEIEVLKESGIRLLVTNYNLSSGISCRVVGIPLVVLFSGTLSPQYFKSNMATFPDQLENPLTMLVPSAIKNRIYNWYIVRSKSLTRFFNNVAKHYGKKPYAHYLDILKGDYFLACDDINFLMLKSTPEYPKENYVGPILSGTLNDSLSGINDKDIYQHLKKPGKSILFTMGSSGEKNIFLKIISGLNKTEWNIVVIYTNILQDNELPKVADNILLKKYVPSIRKVYDQVDLAIIHGGRGTVYTAAYSGKPIIGIPKQFEQQYNIDCLIRHGSGIRLSKKYFSSKRLLNAIDSIFSNYEYYKRNANDLANLLNEKDSVKNTVFRLIDIINQNTKTS